MREWYEVGFISDRVDPEGNRVWFAAYRPVPSVTGMGTRLLAGPKTGMMLNGMTTHDEALRWLHNPEREVEARRAGRATPATRKRR